MFCSGFFPALCKWFVMKIFSESALQQQTKKTQQYYSHWLCLISFISICLKHHCVKLRAEFTSTQINHRWGGIQHQPLSTANYVYLDLVSHLWFEASSPVCDPGPPMWSESISGVREGRGWCVCVCVWTHSSCNVGYRSRNSGSSMSCFPLDSGKQASDFMALFTLTFTRVLVI